MKKEWIEAAKKAKDANELYDYIKTQHVEVEFDLVKEYFDKLHTEGELSDDELDNISGGGCTIGVKPKEQKIRSITANGYKLGWNCPVCHNDCWWEYYATIQRKEWYCSVCEVTHGIASAPRVNQPGRDFPFTQVRIDLE